MPSPFFFPWTYSGCVARCTHQLHTARQWMPARSIRQGSNAARSLMQSSRALIAAAAPADGGDRWCSGVARALRPRVGGRPREGQARPGGDRRRGGPAHRRERRIDPAHCKNTRKAAMSSAVSRFQLASFACWQLPASCPSASAAGCSRWTHAACLGRFRRSARCWRSAA